MNKQIFCPNCGHANNADEKFCANCGQSLVDVVQPTPPTENNTTSQAKTCPNCGQVVEAGTLFCENCGFNLANGHKATATNPSQTAPKTSKTVATKANKEPQAQKGARVSARKSKGNKKPLIATIAGVVVLAAAIGGGYVYYSPERQLARFITAARQDKITSYVDTSTTATDSNTKPLQKYRCNRNIWLYNKCYSFYF
ncbi:zinc ribbon domain-containing protein [Ligilactobacillus equi]|uniref:zinc ribbon domain-containing protein n=1 Tax=Ligilactobacillus equi TaxID=137357 RepID=UPI002ED54A74